MSTLAASHPTTSASITSATRADVDNPVFQSFWLLRIAFTVAPILFGADKFAHVMTNWDKYLAPEFVDLLNVQAHTLMYVVGAIEIVAGLVVLVRPRFGAYLVAAWLVGIIVNLAMIGGYYDVALRDFGLFLSALALGRLSGRFARAESRVARG
jgi:uncharacterized membrane protein YphA (DoxX/SURF4 family)